MLYKKDFKAIAEIIKTEGDVYGYVQPCRRLAYELADYLSTTNPNFNREKFLDACGVN